LDFSCFGRGLPATSHYYERTENEAGDVEIVIDVRAHP
jgi:hypothetical protein